MTRDRYEKNFGRDIFDIKPKLKHCFFNIYSALSA